MHQGRIHEIMVRVYYADTDFSGVVYHGRYLEFFERGRTEFLRTVGIGHKDLWQKNAETGEKLAFTVHHMTLEFIKSASIDDLLVVQTAAKAIRGARIIMEQKIFCRKGEQTQKSAEVTLLTQAEVEVVLFNERGQPRRFPKKWIEKIFNSLS